MASEKKTLAPRPTPCGKYKHYKGGEYEVIGYVHHSETTEQLVLYKQLDKDTGLWVRPYDMFFGTVMVDGIEKDRFQRVSS